MRTRKQIDQEYAMIAQIYGDRIFKGAKIQEEIKALHDKMNQLSQENCEDGQHRVQPVPAPEPPPASPSLPVPDMPDELAAAAKKKVK